MAQIYFVIIRNMKAKKSMDCFNLENGLFKPSEWDIFNPLIGTF